MVQNIEKELVKAREELVALKAEYSEYVYVVSHDLIAPLRQIEGFSSIIYDKYADQFDDKTKRHFGLIVSGAEKGKAILEALLVYSRQSNTEAPFEMVDCFQKISDVTDELSLLITESGADISCVGAPAICGDSSQIHLLFYHLIHNALHYRSPDRKPNISIEATEVDLFWEFCVKDNGIGFSEKDYEKIFTVLRRAVSEKAYSGIGMGLSIATKIVQRHGGRMWVSSEVGVGSSFYFSIAKDLPCER